MAQRLESADLGHASVVADKVVIEDVGLHYFTEGGEIEALRKLQLLAEEVRLILGNYKETSGRVTNALKHLE